MHVRRSRPYAAAMRIASSRRRGSPCRRRDTAGSSSSCRCSPTAWSTRGHDVTLFASGGSRTKANARLAACRAARSARCSATPGSTRYHALASYLADRRRVRRRARPRGDRRAGLRRAAARHARRSCTRCTGRGPSRPRRFYSLLAAPRASRRDQRCATRRQPRRPVRGHRAQRHRPRRLPVPRGQGRLPRLHRARQPRQGPDRRDHDRPAAPACRSHMVAQDATSRPSARTGTRSSSRCSRRSRAVRERSPHEQKIDLLGRASAMVFPIQWPEPFGLVMVEAMACGTPGRRVPGGRGGRAGRGRSHRLPAATRSTTSSTPWPASATALRPRAAGASPRCSPPSRCSRATSASTRGAQPGMNVAVTGAYGHVGANLVHALLDAGHAVRAVDLREGPGARRPRRQLRPGRRARRRFAAPAFDGVEVVYHLAAKISIAGDPDGSVRRHQRRRRAQRRERRARHRRAPLRARQLDPRLRLRSSRA